MKNIENNIISKNNGLLSSISHQFELTTLGKLMDYVRGLPYGRSGDRTDLSLVLINQSGTCSSKHALIKAIAVENGWPDIELVLVMYKMNAANTPDTENVFNDIKLDYIPEAHCCLNIEGKMIDLTNQNSDFNNIKSDVLEIIQIEPEFVFKNKSEYHKSYLKSWAKELKLEQSLDELWSIRELCIACLSE